MAGNVSKNQRRGQRVEFLTCKCGGKIEMRTRMEKAKIRHFAQCTGNCGKTSRKPKDLM